VPSLRTREEDLAGNDSATAFESRLRFVAATTIACRRAPVRTANGMRHTVVFCASRRQIVVWPGFEGLAAQRGRAMGAGGARVELDVAQRAGRFWTVALCSCWALSGIYMVCSRTHHGDRDIWIPLDPKSGRRVPEKSRSRAGEAELRNA